MCVNMQCFFSYSEASIFSVVTALLFLFSPSLMPLMGSRTQPGNESSHPFKTTASELLCNKGCRCE